MARKQSPKRWQPGGTSNNPPPSWGPKVPEPKPPSSIDRRQLLKFGLGGAALLGGTGAILAWAPIPDIGDVCKSQPEVVKAILVDPTDREFVSSDQKKNLDKFVLEDLPKDFLSGYRLHIAVLTESPTYPIRLIWDGCSPGRGHAAKRFYQTAELIEKQFQEGFYPPYKQALSSVMHPMADGQTPILTGITQLHKEMRRSYPDARLELHVISDLLQHERHGPSAYVSESSPRSILARGASHPAVPQTQMKDTSISFFVLHRPGRRSASGYDMEVRQQQMMSVCQEIFGSLTSNPVDVRLV